MGDSQDSKSTSGGICAFVVQEANSSFPGLATLRATSVFCLGIAGGDAWHTH